MSSHITAVYQGVDGAYSQLVLEAWFAARGMDVRTVGVPSYREVATSLAGLRADAGVLPIENAIVGTVRETYDLLAEYDAMPIGEALMRTDHHLLGVRGASLSDVREVLAHPLVIAECGRFLSSLTQARAIPCEDTGVAAREVSRGGNPSIAALAPASAAALYDLVELARDCADDPRTFSRFLILRPRIAAPGALNDLKTSAHRKTSLIFTLADAPGKLARALAHLDAAKVNLSKLESKPRLGHASDHVFYVDLDGDAADERVAEALEGIRREAQTLTVLGSYDAHQGEPLEAGSDDATATTRPPLVTSRAHLSNSSHGLGSTAAKSPKPAAAFPRVDRESKPHGTVVQVGGVRIGGGDFTIIGGPCSVESREQVMATAQA
ncbi:MAG TPA: prephenate dehydratase domain-containing protein, partial [Candidatus Baltobacteraceae bacterium]